MAVSSYPILVFNRGTAMYAGRTLFSQVMDFIPWTSFDRIVVKYGGDIGVRTLRRTEHFVSNGKMGDALALELQRVLGAHRPAPCRKPPGL
jgi:hypothetical protein